MVGLALDLSCAEPEQLFELPVHEQVAAFAVLQRDHRGAVVEDRLELLLALTNRVIGGSEPGREVAEQPAEQQEAAYRA